ncbi:MAG: hypothetical protein ACRDDY_17575 [Clostridium sp.]|uniref:hypothetical protein n=1 Tax=Clostridium sp. TaxID=1506 RepID=UPI003EE60EEA
MEEKFNLKIRSGINIKVDCMVDRALIVTEKGEFTILKDFHNFLGCIEKGNIEFFYHGKIKKIPIEEGILEFSDNKCEVLE